MSTAKFNLNSLKGRLAEQLVKDMFLQSNFNVFSYGIEILMPAYLNNHSSTSIDKNLRFMPDFVVQDIASSKLYYLEVKFRANGRFSIAELPENYPYTNAWFIIVSPNKIQCIGYNLLSQNKEITPSSNFSLKGIDCFPIDNALLKEYEKHARILFKGFAKEETPASN